MLFWSPNCLGISYSAANYFTFKPFVPPQKKFKKTNRGGAHFIAFAPEKPSYTTGYTSCSNERKVNRIGADLHTAIMATAPGEKLLIGRSPMRNYTHRTISSLFLCRQLHLFLGKSTKTAATTAALFDSNMHQIVCWPGLCPIPFCGSLQRSPRSVAVFTGPVSKGRGGEKEKKGGERRRGEGGSLSFAVGRKKKSRRL